MRGTTPDRISAFRPALLCVLAMALLGAQVILQTHSISHDLLPSSHQVCEHCVVAKASAAPPRLAATAAPAASMALLSQTPSVAPTSRAPLVERNRGPPAPV